MNECFDSCDVYVRVYVQGCFLVQPDEEAEMQPRIKGLFLHPVRSGLVRVYDRSMQHERNPENLLFYFTCF